MSRTPALHDQHDQRPAGPPGQEPDWVRHAIWWHVYPLGFVGADTAAPATGDAGAPPAGRAGHRLTRLTDWLDYAVELGASGLALGPVFDSVSHGYDTTDYYRLDPRLGDDADYDALVQAAHARGLKVLLDGVFNHVGRDFATYRTALADGPQSPAARWFLRDDHAAGDPAGTGQVRYRTFEGHPGLVTLNHANPEVVDYVVEVMNHWLARGADGWRLDAAYAVPTSFWAAVLPRVRAAHPDAYLVGEVIHGDYRAIVAESGLDAVTQYELWKAIWSSINDVNLFELAWALDRQNTLLETFVPFTFVGNHDVTRLASRLIDARHLAHALVVWLTVGGTPAIYYGDEQAFTGIKEDRVGGDDAVRPAFPAVPAELSPAGAAVHRLHQQLIGVRRRHPWLHRARTNVTVLTNTVLVYEASAEGHAVQVVLNLADTDYRDDTAGSLLAGSAGADTTVPGHGWAIRELAAPTG